MKTFLGLLLLAVATWFVLRRAKPKDRLEQHLQEKADLRNYGYHTSQNTLANELPLAMRGEGPWTGIPFNPISVNDLSGQPREGVLYPRREKNPFIYGYN